MFVKKGLMYFKNSILAVFFIAVCAILIIFLLMAFTDSETGTNLEFLGVSQFDFDIDTELLPPSVSFNVSLYFFNPSTSTATIKDVYLDLIVNNSIVALLDLQSSMTIPSGSYFNLNVSNTTSSTGLSGTTWNLLTTGDFFYTISGSVNASTMFGVLETPIAYSDKSDSDTSLTKYQTTITLHGPFYGGLGDSLTISGCLGSEGLGLETELNRQILDIQIDGHSYNTISHHYFFSLCQNGYFEGTLSAEQVNNLGIGTHLITVSFSGSPKYQASSASSTVHINIVTTDSDSRYTSQLTIDDLAPQQTLKSIQLTANLDCIECLIDDICNGKMIIWYYRQDQNQSWQLIDLTITHFGFTHGNGQTEKDIGFFKPGTYYIRATFNGDSDLSKSYDETIITIT